jgi:hypothetical protein
MTVAKRRTRSFVHNAAMGPKEPASTGLSKEKESVRVVFQRHRLLPLNDYSNALPPMIPHLSLSSLHRC